jgi:hypothetical protein
MYSCPDINRAIKLRRWAGHVVCMEERELHIQGFDGETWGKETTWKKQA